MATRTTLKPVNPKTEKPQTRVKRISYHESGKPRDLVGVHDKRRDPFEQLNKKRYGTDPGFDHDKIDVRLPDRPDKMPKNQGRRWYTDRTFDYARIEEYATAYWYCVRAVELTKNNMRGRWALEQKLVFYLKAWRNKQDRLGS